MLKANEAIPRARRIVAPARVPGNIADLRAELANLAQVAGPKKGA